MGHSTLMKNPKQKPVIKRPKKIIDEKTLQDDYNSFCIDPDWDSVEDVKYLIK